MPSAPGIYIFNDEKRNSLYIGKSKNLKARIKSYFQAKSENSKRKIKIDLMLAASRSIDVFLTKSNFQAVLLEAELIQFFQPKYNSRLRDDKSPLYIVISKEKFPRVLLQRKGELGTIIAKHQFGPFTSRRAAKRVISQIRKIFPFCNKKIKNERPCFWFHLSLCPGACIGKMNSTGYDKVIKNIEALLSGKLDNLSKKITRQMKSAAKKKDFEKAKDYRDTLGSLEQLKIFSGDNGDREINGPSFSTVCGVREQIDVPRLEHASAIAMLTNPKGA